MTAPRDPTHAARIRLVVNTAETLRTLARVHASREAAEQWAREIETAIANLARVA